MNDLTGKKLLLLGGVTHSMEIVKAAHNMGVLCYVTDYFETSECKKIADKAFTVSTVDVEAVKKLCEDEQIDGVITGFIDSMLPYCGKVCEELGMPFWGTQEQIETCIDKKLFKDACRAYGVPTAREYAIDADADGVITEECLNRISYPVIVKPVDSSGSRGVYTCETKEELRENYVRSLSFSKSRTVIVEECLRGQHVNMYYTLSDGEIVLSAMADRYVDYLDGQSAPLPVVLVHPSRYLSAYEEQVNEKVKDMFRGLGMKNGLAFVQGFHCNDGSFRVYEMGYRLNGGATYALINACEGYNQLEMLIRFSLTGKMGSDELLKKSTPHFGKLAVNYVFSVNGGSIAKIEGIEEARRIPGMESIVQVRFAGDKVTGKGGSAQVVAYVLFTAENKEEIKAVLDEVCSCIKVTGENGEVMKPVLFDTNEIEL